MDAEDTCRGGKLADATVKGLAREVNAALKTIGLKASSDLSAAGITKAYRTASRKAHPDSGGSTEAMTRVNAAYELLHNAPATVELAKLDWEKAHRPKAPAAPPVEPEAAPAAPAATSPTTQKWDTSTEPVGRSEPVADHPGYYAPPPGSRNAPEAFPGKREGRGWKLHLTVNPENIAAATESLRNLGVLFKHESGGTHEEGKDFTIYIGSKAKAARIAGEISKGMADLLAEPQGDVLKDDTPMASRVMGRFDVGDPYHQYVTREGLPATLDIVSEAYKPGRPWTLDEKQWERSHKKVKSEFGTFAMGETTESTTPPAATPSTPTTPTKGALEAGYDAWDKSIQETGQLPEADRKFSTLAAQSWQEILNRGYTPEEAREQFISQARTGAWLTREVRRGAMRQFPKKSKQKNKGKKKPTKPEEVDNPAWEQLPEWLTDKKNTPKDIKEMLKCLGLKASGNTRAEMLDAALDLFKKPEDQGGKPKRPPEKKQLKKAERKVAAITRQLVARVFPGRRIEPARGGGWHVFVGDTFATIRPTEWEPIDWDEAEKAYGPISPEQREMMQNLGSFEVQTADGVTFNGFALIRLTEGLADTSTLRHEALHLARAMGLLKESEWNALVDEYAPGEINPATGEAWTPLEQEETVAQSFDGSPESATFWERLASSIRRLVARITGRPLTARDVKLLMQTEGFWARKEQTIDGGRRGKYSVVGDRGSSGNQAGIHGNGVSTSAVGKPPAASPSSACTEVPSW